MIYLSLIHKITFLMLSLVLCTNRRKASYQSCMGRLNACLQPAQQAAQRCSLRDSCGWLKSLINWDTNQLWWQWCHKCVARCSHYPAKTDCGSSESEVRWDERCHVWLWQWRIVLHTLLVRSAVLSLCGFSHSPTPTFGSFAYTWTPLFSMHVMMFGALNDTWWRATPFFLSFYALCCKKSRNFFFIINNTEPELEL